MKASVRSILDLGTRSSLVEIECHLSNNLPAIVIVGSASKAVDEARERVRAAFASSHLELPRKRITINLAPADLTKSDSSFDLAIATAILLKTDQVQAEKLENSLVIGELGLNGMARGARGIIGKILAGRKLGYNRYFLPESNIAQARLIPNVTIFPVRDLKQFYDYLTTGAGIDPLYTHDGTDYENGLELADFPDLSEIIGQSHAKRALEIAAAGGHNVFLSGPPGTGKSMLAKALPSLLPKLNHEEILEVTQLYSLANNDYEHPLITRPFRAPHHSSSLVALIGGGHSLRPGEISLSHRGVLFLDEIPEFNRNVLEALRQPLEDHVVTIARAKDTVTYPADFILVATANPCPCGYYGSAKSCTCSPHQIIHYQQRVSGPILDRIDLHSIVQDIDHKNLLRENQRHTGDDPIRSRVAKARAVQAKRYHSAIRLNSAMTNREIRSFALLTDPAKIMLDTAAARLNISARSYMKTVKVARTIADLADSRTVETAHVAEALQYRRQEAVALL